MKIACAPKDVRVSKKHDLRFMLFDRREKETDGHIGASILPIIRRLKLNPEQRAWDFLAIALSVIAADETISRTGSADGWTRSIDLSVAVSDPKHWSKQVPKFEQALGFLSTDRWKLTLTDGGIAPKPLAQASGRPEDCVCLLSGGLDSLIGALDLQADGQRPYLASQVAKGDKGKQKELARLVGGTDAHLQLNHNVKPPRGYSERSQRSRSIVFIAYGVLAATCLDRYKKGETVNLYVPENGFISLNVPLTPLRLASHSTRTTHPHFMALVQDLLLSAGIRVRLVNPYQFKTKGEMLAGCKNQKLLKSHASNTTSCGRYARSAFQHCGRCVPCQIRRAAFQHWGSDPTPSYKYKNLGIKDEAHAGFDDVRSMGIAMETVRRRGLTAWIGSGLAMLPPGSRKDYIDVLDRGIKEIAALLRKAGVK